MFPREHMKTSCRVMGVPDPSPQDMACLRTVDIMRYGLHVYHATSHDCTPRAWGPRNVPWTPSMRSEYFFITYVVLFVQR
jgi:hypothetical protein